MYHIYIPTTDKDLSVRKAEEYDKISKIINWGRGNPVRFAEEVFGIMLIDYQAWAFMSSWEKKYILWLCCRAWGKTSSAAVFLMTKTLLIPNYTVYISTNSAAQSIEVFKKIEDIAYKRIPSFKTCTDIFQAEVDKNGGKSKTGFIYDPSGHRFRLFNGSGVVTLSTNLDAIRGKRGAVFFDETGWQSKEQFATLEPFASVDTDFSLGVGNHNIIDPKNFPLQLMFASSASDVTYDFYSKYKEYSKKMLIGDPNYFVCDINAGVVLNHSTVKGEPIKPHLSASQIDQAMDEDPERAEREYYNKFSKGGSENSVVKMDTIVANSEVYLPLLYNDTGKRKFIFCYDPARNFDGSILAIFELVDTKDGYKIRIVNMVSFVDTESRKKTPMPMPDQLRIIRELLVRYNGERAAEYENVEFYIDAGAGGGGISAVADNLMEDFVDLQGNKHHGIIDPEHKQYETARRKFPDAIPIVHLIEPTQYKRIMYDALEKMTKFGLMIFPDYDGKDEIILVGSDGEPEAYTLSFDEKLGLTQINLAKTEVVYMRRTETANGNIQYELARDKRNVIHDDRAYTLAMGAFALSQKRRKDLINKPLDSNQDIESLFKFRAPAIRKGGHN